jgi:hypothetical protein
MSKIQTDIEQAFKEYLDFKLFLEAETKDMGNKRSSMAERVLEMETPKDYAELFFDTVGYLHPLNIDFMQIKTRLFHYYNLAKDIIEIPKEIVKELEGFDVKYTFAVKNGKKEIVDNGLYDAYKKQQVDIAIAQEQNKQGLS